MAVFPKKKYVSTTDANGIAAKYRASLAKHPFLLFGLPFMAVIVAGSFVLTPATAVRFERHDRKVRQMTKEEELGVGRAGRKVDIKDEYYVSCGPECAPDLPLEISSSMVHDSSLQKEFRMLTTTTLFPTALETRSQGS